MAALLERSPDLIVEAAGHDAIREFGAPILAEGVDLIVLSAGALADRDVEASLRLAGPGNLMISTGALAGLDGIRGFLLSGTLREVSLTSTTLPSLAIQPWMHEDERRRVMEAEGPLTVYSGTARELAQHFPQSANVAATVGLASLGMDQVRAELRVDPRIGRKRHRLQAAADIGKADITIESTFSPDNPRTSALTPFAVLRLLTDLTSIFRPGV